ncbi:MAG: HAMP domain-containing sensor histidine kinase [Bauldia sp.]
MRRFDEDTAAAHHFLVNGPNSAPTERLAGDRIDARTGKPVSKPRIRIGLSWKLLSLAFLIVIVGEVLVFVPSIANFRTTWLRDRLATATAAAIVLAASDWTDVPRELQDDLLAAVGADAIAIRTGEVSRLLATVEVPPTIERLAEVNNEPFWVSTAEAVRTLFEARPHTLRVVGATPRQETIDLVLSDAPLHAEMLAYSRTALIASLLTSLPTGAIVFVALNLILVGPIRRMSQAMVRFSEAPEDPARVVGPPRRSDEIGVAEEHLAAMQRDLQQTLQQRKRLAELGLAVSKINHDLRNILASAHLLSDRLAAIPDPSVQRFAPKLIAALDRAIAYCKSTLAYGRASEAPPERRLIILNRLVKDVAELLGLDNQTSVRWENSVPPDLEIDADPDQLYRVLLNLCRNALEAMEGSEPILLRRLAIDAERTGGVVTIRVRDTGPGVPPKARAHLFQAFQGSARPGGTGLGLAIAAELVRAHGGTIDLVDTSGPGSTFAIAIPDRPIEFSRHVRAAAG